jgi:hypothetical protein
MPETDEIVDAEVEEESDNLPAVRETAVNLFGESSPVAVVARATEVATALASVVEQKELFKQIGRKKHVYVEGWTLLGSMLGVFPVVEWTRKTDDGWEARVSARTMTGAEVGAAEAMCSRREEKWKDRDEYAIRSMAQTRAVSKALRHPLGFVMTLAGYEATPEAEMPDDKPVEFNVARDLLENAPRGKDAVQEAMKNLDPTLEWPVVIAQAIQSVYNTDSWRNLNESLQGEFWTRLANALGWIHAAVGSGDFPPAPPDKIVAGFAYAFDGVAVELVWLEPDDAPLGKTPED